ncbi:MAG TPA: SAM-dependent methyltransferase [Polyangia bacterium]|nr:SAM-dependent methyltransferase [Polyangia bacterium]
MIKILVEESVRYDRSLAWRIHDAYFEQRGVRAWLAGEIPFLSTSNAAVARQHATFLAAHVEGLRERGLIGETFELLEVGGGAGTFAAHVVRALDAQLAPELAARLRYLFTDVSARTLREAIEGPELRELVAAGRVVPALYDARETARLRTLDGAPLGARPVALVANYLCCVMPTRFFRKQGGEWRELYVSLSTELDDPEAAEAAAVDREAAVASWLADATRAGLQERLALAPEWRAVELTGALGAQHREILERHTAHVEAATVTFPQSFFEFLAGARPLLAPGGLVLMTDYGHLAGARHEGATSPRLYGNSLNHAVDFLLVERFAEAARWSIMRTAHPLSSLHTLVLYAGGAPERTRAAFDAAYVQRTDGQDLLDFSDAARASLKRDKPAQAVRHLERCIALDPEHAGFHHRLGEAYLAAGLPEQALAWLDRGAALDRWRVHDFDLLRGRACAEQRQLTEAAAWLRDSIARKPSPEALLRLGQVLEALGELHEAVRAYRGALALEPEHEEAQARCDRLKDLWWEQLLADLDAPVEPERDRER